MRVLGEQRSLRSGRRLHVAALPYPTSQGTQAAIARIAAAHSQGDHRVALLTYGARAFSRKDPFDVLRSPALPGRERFRSGPSLRKLAHNALLARALRSSVEPNDRIVAHHVEAAALCALSIPKPFAFFAHTGLSQELPDYFAAQLEPILSRAGAQLDGWLCRRASLVCAISPTLASQLSTKSETPTHYVPTPWTVKAQTTERERAEHRHALGLRSDTTCLVYLGNLDRYQGWWRMIEALAFLRAHAPRRTFELHIYTTSPSDAVLSYARREGVLGQVRISGLPHDEAGRASAYATSDLVLVPRKTPGGLPIKLLDAMARGRAVVATERATAGLSLDKMIAVTPDDGHAMGSTILSHLQRPPAEREAMAMRGRAYIAEWHSDDHVRARLEELLSAHLPQTSTGRNW